jgi:ComF family protein
MTGRWIRRSVSQVCLLGRDMFSLLVPPLCVGCERRLTGRESWLCRHCRLTLACEARPVTRSVEIDNGISLGIKFALGYTPRVSRIISEMKYGDKPGLAGFLVPFLAFAVGHRIAAGTVAVPVPLHPSKRRERGYNQSSILAKGIAESKGLRINDILVKLRTTVSQTTLDRDRRESNVMGCFSVGKPGTSGIERVLLVDDVVTTGSTLRECARALLAAGVKEISACAVAGSL